MNKVNLVGYGIFALLAFPAMAETEDIKQNPEEAVLAIDETGTEIAKEAYSTPGKVTASINLGTLSGEAKERVYDDTQGGRKLSQLNWNYNSAPIIKASIEWDLMKRLSLGFSGWRTLHSTAGKMDDYDWLNAAQQQWTHHSYHSDTDLKHAYEIDLNLKYWLFNQPSWRFGLMAGYQDKRSLKTLF